jgi:hypothetical protein
MSDYTKSTDFASKDSLASGNAAKIVKGTEIDTEFNNIATAIATKADLASPGFSGSPTAPTQSSGDSSTKLATTAFVQAALATLYPVGSIYTNAAVSTNPGTLLGFGTWSAFGAGRVMVGLDAGNAAFDTAQETGGSADAIVVSHTHSASFSGNALTSHTHTLTTNASGASDANGGKVYPLYDSGSLVGTAATPTWPQVDSASAGTPSGSVSVSTEGSSATNANLQPYIVVYMWRRTA